MNTILNAGENNQPSPFIEHNPENSTRQAKVTGLLCISFAVLAIGSLKSSSSLYFLFLILSMVTALVAYSEIKAIGSSWISSLILLISVASLFVLLLIAFGSPKSGQFLIIYGFLSTLTPILLAILAIKENNVERWKALVPLTLPVLFVISFYVGDFLRLSILPLGWGLIGIVGYLGNRSHNS